MADRTVKLVLGEGEVEVLEEALDLYLRARPAAADHRFDYRYRIAHGILGTLEQTGRMDASDIRGDDDPASRGERRSDRRAED